MRDRWGVLAWAAAALVASCTDLREDPADSADSSIEACSGGRCRDGGERDAGASEPGADRDAGASEPRDASSPAHDAGDAGCERNECGGCGPLSAEVGTDCGACGKYACDGDRGDVECVDPGRNACNGCAQLVAAPGSGCGCNGSFSFACDGQDAVACSDPGANACGGCGVLNEAPNSACGVCGTQRCNATNTAVSCDDPGANACGGCSTLTQALGGSCGACGAYVCGGPNAITCSDPGLNACNGCGALEGAPQSTCNGCGKWKCASATSVSCDMASCEIACNDPLPKVAFPTVLVGSGSPPQPTGGTPRDGVYQQTRITIYGSYDSVPGDAFELRGGFMHQTHTTYHSSGSALTGWTITGIYSVAGAGIAIEATHCAMQATTQSLWRFTANGDELRLFSNTATTTWVQTFQRVP